MFTLLNNFLRIQSAGILGFVLPDRGKAGVNPASHRARSHELNKVYVNASQAISDIVRDGQLIAVGGFGLCGIPAFFTPTGPGYLDYRGQRGARV